MIDLDFEFSAKLWEWSSSGEQGGGSWHFVTLPESISKDIKSFTKHRKTSFGSVRVRAQCGQTEWLTSLFPSKEKSAYLLPIKKSVRRAEKLRLGDKIDILVNILL